MSETIWDDIPCVWIKSFYGWSPETWGCVGFTPEGRTASVARQTSDPFIMVVCVTKKAPTKDPELRGTIAGFYVVSHIEGHRDEFTASSHHGKDPEQWVRALKAIRAFAFLPEYRLSIDEFDPTISTGMRSRAIGTWGEELAKPQIEKLRRLPFVETRVFGGSADIDPNITAPTFGQHKVKAGPVNRSGYFVPGEPLDTPKELYALKLVGDTSQFLGESANGRKILKIGLSMSPCTRLASFQQMMPRGAFTWDILRSTLQDGHDRYPSFEAAEAGENRMKDLLGKKGDWLGGEFYAATKDVFEEAWDAGRRSALAYSKKLRS